MNYARSSFLILVMLTICGCASAPVRYYTLIPLAESSTAAPANACCDVEIRSLRIPSGVNRPELVTRQSNEQVAVLSNDLWIAPLRDEVRNALLNDIRVNLLQAKPGRSASTKRYVVFIDVSRFESSPANYALIQAQWRVTALAAPKSEVQLCTTTAQVNIAGGVSEMVLGYQQAISKVASGITAKLLSAADGGDYQCPTQ
jgi:uncharacterized lipoprotein YmbA